MARSKIWSVSAPEFKSMIASSTNYTDALRKFDLRAAGNNHRTLKNRIKAEGVDAAHFKAGANAARRVFCKTNCTPLSEIMVKDSTYSRSHLKGRLLREGVLENRCGECGQDGVWNKTPLVMVLDHINGCPTDHRQGNLRMLCPNCNSQQPTFAGRNRRPQAPTQKPSRMCSDCGSQIMVKNKSGLCRACSHPSKLRVADPALVGAQIRQLGFRSAAALHGVSDTTLRKWAIRWGVV